MFEVTNEDTRAKFHKITYVATICLIVVFILVILSVFVVVPLVFMLSLTVQEHLVFTRFGLPRSKSAFERDFPGVKNFYIPVNDIESNETINLGAWHLLPWSVLDEYTNSTSVIDYDELLANSSHNVIIHFHGTGETRLDSRNMFVILRFFFHVIAFDYRGYGDSSDGRMSERAVVDDCVQIYKWVQNRTNAKIYIWGHSLGASLALHTIALLTLDNTIPEGLVLESAFTTFREELPLHPYGQVFAWLPWFSATILNPLEKNGFIFNNSKHILDTPCPIMMFHAEDDSIIPLKLGNRLFEIAVDGRNSTFGTIIFHQIPGYYKCDHFWAYRYPYLPSDLQDFINMTSTKQTGVRIG